MKVRACKELRVKHGQTSAVREGDAHLGRCCVNVVDVKIISIIIIITIIIV